MAELKMKKSARQMEIRHRGRGSQVSICFGKLLRMFVYQNDWKVLPMAALIAGLVGMVIRKKFFINMEGTLMGAFSMVCVCIWNGCFNSIQVICRERDVIKREHRSGMHISSYIVSHMMYQALLCLAQTVITIYVTMLVGVQYPGEGLITSSFLLDFLISMFLITYASDMMSLWVSSLSHNTTTAMTVMPFVLIFQLVFSGGMMTLPAWTKTLTEFTISNPALKVIAAQADTNHRPYATISSMLDKMRDNEIGGTFTLGQALDLMQDAENPAVAELREKKIAKTLTLDKILSALDGLAVMDEMKQKELTPGFTVGDALDALDASGLAEEYGKQEVRVEFTVGEVIDLTAKNNDAPADRDREITVKTTLGKVLDLVGEDRVKAFLEEKAAAASYNPDYECDPFIVVGYWMDLTLFILVFALLATVTLEFIDKDKR